MTPDPAAAAAAEDFPVEFEDPADALETWHRDDMHMPFALPGLAADFISDVIGSSFNVAYETFGERQRNYGRVFNGWSYFSFRSNVPEAEEAAQEARWIEACRARIPHTLAYWRDEAMPELRSIFDWMAAIPVEDLAPGALAEAWATAWRRTLDAWIIHFLAIPGAYQVLDDLIDAYQAALGTGREGEALALLAGVPHELEAVEEGVEALAELAGPAGGALATAIELAAGEGHVTDPIDLEALRAHPGGDAFLDALGAFLDEHGHLGQNHDDLRLASWAEAPRLLLGRIVTRRQAALGPERDRQAALRRRAEELAAEARAALAGKPDEVARFDAVLAQALEVGWLTEGHNYWIDRLSQARLRALSLRVGARLAGDGVIEAPEDVFFLHRGEVGAAIVDGESRHDLVERRREEHAINERRTPPEFVGKVPDKPSQGDRFDAPPVISTEADRLVGKGASAGVARGPARVTLTQDDFNRIQPGDIVVCPSSNPSWVPVFAIAGGLVTNTGGVLSHAAVVAREFGLPAVVGTGDATTKIPDGRLVEIDGTAGTVRLL